LRKFIGNQPIAALTQRRGERRFARARRPAEQDRLAAHLDRACVKDDLLALMQQNPEHRPEDEDGNVFSARLRTPERTQSDRRL
jgi:hypothetical protein